MNDDMQVCKQFVENESFKCFVGDKVYEITRDRLNCVAPVCATVSIPKLPLLGSFLSEPISNHDAYRRNRPLRERI